MRGLKNLILKILIVGLLLLIPNTADGQALSETISTKSPVTWLAKNKKQQAKAPGSHRASVRFKPFVPCLQHSVLPGSACALHRQ